MNICRMVVAAAAIAGAIAAAEAPAHAATLTLDGGTAGMTRDAGAKNVVLPGLGLGRSVAGFLGTTVMLDGASSIRVDFLGYEAGYRNRFTFAGNGFYTETDDLTPSDNREIFAEPPSYTTGSLSGLLDFVFSTGGKAGSVANGANPTDTGNRSTGVNFFASIVGAPTSTSGRSVMLFFDDNGGSNDDDYDDLVIRLSVVPVPATLPLLLGALSGFGLVARQRRARLTA